MCLVLGLEGGEERVDPDLGRYLDYTLKKKIGSLPQCILAREARNSMTLQRCVWLVLGGVL